MPFTAAPIFTECHTSFLALSAPIGYQGSVYRNQPEPNHKTVMQPLRTSLLTTEELTTASDRLSPVMTPLLAGQPALLAISAAADANRTAIIAAAARQASSDFTGPLRESDARRDAAFTTLRDFAATWGGNPGATPEQRAAGTRLEGVFGRHGNTLHRLGYTRQSGKMSELIAELGTPGPTADLTLLGLLPLFTQMGAAHDEFEGLMADKAAAEGGDDLPTVTANSPDLERRLNLLLAAIEEWQEVAPTPALEEAIGRMDEIIVQVAAPALARRTLAQQEPAPAPAP
jgi:hypothetical protein